MKGLWAVEWSSVLYQALNSSTQHPQLQQQRLCAHQHLTDDVLRDVLFVDPFQSVHFLLSEVSVLSGSTIHYLPLERMDRLAATFALDEHRLRTTFQQLFDTQTALQILQDRYWKQKQKQMQETKRRRLSQRGVNTRKVPRRTLLSNITDYDADLEDDFFSTLIEQVRLPTFTIEQYYDNADDEDNESIEESPVIYREKDLIQELQAIQTARLKNTFIGKVRIPKHNRAKMRFPWHSKGKGRDKSVRTFLFSYTACWIRKNAVKVWYGLDFNVPQCPISGLEFGSVDQICEKRFQRALERILHFRIDASVSAFHQVPFPHHDLQDLQLMAVDVLHHRRYHHRLDPSNRVAFCLDLPFPSCNVDDLRMFPSEDLIRRRYQRSVPHTFVSTECRVEPSDSTMMLHVPDEVSINQLSDEVSSLSTSTPIASISNENESSDTLTLDETDTEWSSIVDPLGTQKSMSPPIPFEKAKMKNEFNRSFDVILVGSSSNCDTKPAYDSDMIAENEESQSSFSKNMCMRQDIDKELNDIQSRLQVIENELQDLKNPLRLDPDPDSESLSLLDISYLREGCDWNVVMDNLLANPVIEGVELLWHMWCDIDENDDLVDVEKLFLKECNDSH